MSKATDSAIRNFVYSGLSLEQMNAVPKWLIENLDKNVPALKKAIKEIEAEAEQYGRLNEHHLISRLFDNDELAKLKPGTRAALKRRMNDIKKGKV